MKAKSKKVFSIIKHIILITICIIMIFPFYWMIATAFKDTYAVYEYPPKIFPNPLVVSNFGKVWELLPFGQAFVNSIKIVLTVVVIQLLTASMAAFAFAKLQFKFRELIFLLVLATMMIPEQVIMIPLFQMFQKVGLIDTHLGLILPTAFCYPFGIFMLRQFIMGLPDSIMEAGKIDGCSYPGIFFKLTLPLIKPALSSLFIFSFLQNWNSFLYPMLFLNSQEKFTLPLMLNTFKGLYFTDWPVLMAACSIVILPVVLVYLSAQKYIIEGIAITSCKIIFDMFRKKEMNGNKQKT